MSSLNNQRVPGRGRGVSRDRDRVDRLKPLESNLRSHSLDTAHLEIPSSVPMDPDFDAAFVNAASNSPIASSAEQPVVYHHVIHHFHPNSSPQIPPRKSSQDVPQTPIIPVSASKPRTLPKSRRKGDDTRTAKDDSPDQPRQTRTPGNILKSPAANFFRSLIAAEGSTDPVSAIKSQSLDPPARNASLPRQVPTHDIHPNPVSLGRYRSYPGSINTTNSPYPLSAHPQSPVDPHSSEDQTVVNLKHVLSLLAVPYLALLAIESTIQFLPTGLKILGVWMIKTGATASTAFMKFVVVVRRIFVDPVTRNRNALIIIFVIFAIKVYRSFDGDRKPKKNQGKVDYSQYPVKQPLYLNVESEERYKLVVEEIDYSVNGKMKRMELIDPKRPARPSDGSGRAPSTLPAFGAVNKVADKHKSLPQIPVSEVVVNSTEAANNDVENIETYTIVVKDPQPKSKGYFFTRKNEKANKIEAVDQGDSTITLNTETPVMSPVSSQVDVVDSEPIKSEAEDSYMQALLNAGIVIPKSLPRVKSEEDTSSATARVSLVFSRASPLSRTSSFDNLDENMPSRKSSHTRKNQALRRSTKRVLADEELATSPLATSPDSPKASQDTSNSQQTLPLSTTKSSPDLRQKLQLPERSVSINSVSQPPSRAGTPPPPLVIPRSGTPFESRLDLSNRKYTQFPPPNNVPTDSHQIQSGFGHVVHYSNAKSDLVPPIITLSSLQNLTHLNLSGNLISRLHENTVSSMPRLICLDVSGNDLDSVPASIGGLTELREFYAGRNRIRMVPHDMSFASSLEVLDLHSNLIEFLHPTIFSRMTRLTTLNLANNRLKILPPSIGLLRDSLKILHVENNNFESSYARLFMPYFEALRESNVLFQREINMANGIPVDPSHRASSEKKRRSFSRSRNRSRNRIDFDDKFVESPTTETRGNRLSSDSYEFKKDSEGSSRSDKEKSRHAMTLARRSSWDQEIDSPSSTTTLEFNYIPFSPAQIPLQRILAYHRDMYDLDPRVQIAVSPKSLPVYKGDDEETKETVTVEKAVLSPEDQATLEEKIKKKQTPERRQAVGMEILTTERTYVQQLQNLVDLYVTPVENGNPEVGVPQQDAHLLFSNVKVLLMFHRDHLLPKLEENFKVSNACLGSVFLEVSQFLKLYSTYYNNFDIANTYCQQMENLANSSDTLISSSASIMSSAASINSVSSATSTTDSAIQAVQRNGRQCARKFRNYMRKVKQDPRHISQISLQSFLILPVQRLPRYKLLIDEYLSTTPSTHPDYESLKKAADEIKRRVQDCNERKREWEEREKGLGVMGKIKVRDASMGVLERLRVVTDGRRFIREFVGHVVKVVDVATGSVGTFGGLPYDFDPSESEIQLLALEGVHAGSNVEPPPKPNNIKDARAYAAHRIDKQLLKSKYNERNTLLAANYKKERYSTSFVGPLAETRFIGRKDEDDKSRELRLFKEVQRDVQIAAREQRLVVGDAPSSKFKPGSISSDTASVSSLSLVGGDALSIYGTSRTSGRDFKFFLFSDILCWCKMKSESEGEYELIRAVSLTLRPNAEVECKKYQRPPQPGLRWPAEVMEVQGNDMDINANGSFGRWSTNSKTSISGSREAIARISDDHCVIYVRGELDAILGVVDAINLCVSSQQSKFC